MWKRIVGGFALLIACGLSLAIMRRVQSNLLTTIHLGLASLQCVYPTAEVSAIAHILHGYEGIERSEIIYAGSNSF
jgi:hypothetical protein